eukprot:gene12813-9160_t
MDTDAAAAAAREQIKNDATALRGAARRQRSAEGGGRWNRRGRLSAAGSGGAGDGDGDSDSDSKNRDRSSGADSGRMAAPPPRRLLR